MIKALYHWTARRLPGCSSYCKCLLCHQVSGVAAHSWLKNLNIKSSFCFGCCKGTMVEEAAHKPQINNATRKYGKLQMYKDTVQCVCEETAMPTPPSQMDYMIPSFLLCAQGRSSSWRQSWTVIRRRRRKRPWRRSLRPWQLARMSGEKGETVPKTSHKEMHHLTFWIGIYLKNLVPPPARCSQM